MRYNVMAMIDNGFGQPVERQVARSAYPNIALAKAEAFCGRVVAVDGQNNAQIGKNFFFGSAVEAHFRAKFEDERKPYRDWKLDHDCAQLFCTN